MRMLALAVTLVALAPLAAFADNPVVRFTTAVGRFHVEVCEAVSARCEHAAPDTAANFLAYVDGGAYDASIVHRSVPDFVIQGGSFRLESGPIVRAVETADAVDNEFDGFPNRRGTLSVPLVGDLGSTSPCDTQEDSGTSGWFVNLKDNSGTLDCGLFTVFAVVRGDGMEVVKDLVARPRLQFSDGISAPQFLWPLFDPVQLITAFTTVPVSQELYDLATTPSAPLPTLQEVADGLTVVNVTRAPEPAAGGAAAALALAALARRGRARA